MAREGKVYTQKYNWTSVFHIDTLRFPLLSTVSESDQGNTAVLPPIFRPLDYPVSPAGTVNQKQKTSCYVLEDSFVGLSFQTHSEHTCFLWESHLLQLYCLEYRFKLGGVKESKKKQTLKTSSYPLRRNVAAGWIKKWRHHHVDAIFSVSKELQGLCAFEPGSVWM